MNLLFTNLIDKSNALVDGLSNALPKVSPQFLDFLPKWSLSNLNQTFFGSNASGESFGLSNALPKCSLNFYEFQRFLCIYMPKKEIINKIFFGSNAPGESPGSSNALPKCSLNFCEFLEILFQIRKFQPKKGNK